VVPTRQKLLVLGVQPTRGLHRVGEPEKGRRHKVGGQDSFDDVDSLQAMEAPALDLHQAICHKSTEGARDGRGDLDIALSHGILVAVVDHGDVHGDAGDDGSLGGQLAEVSNECRADCQCGPAEGGRGHEVLGRQDLEEGRPGRLEEDVGGVEDRDSSAVLVAFEIEVLRKGCKSSVPDARTIC
jgi:hypothetical protein